MGLRGSRGAARGAGAGGLRSQRRGRGRAEGWGEAESPQWGAGGRGQGSAPGRLQALDSELGSRAALSFMSCVTSVKSLAVCLSFSGRRSGC